MRTSTFVNRFPRLYHMAAAGAWPSIREHGLLSTSALLSLFEVPQPRRMLLEATHRPRTEVLEHPTYGSAVIRDQHPMSDAMLTRVLTGGMSNSAWYLTLNSKVFFWPTQDRLDTLLAAYSDYPHTILTLDTKRLLAEYENAIRLSHLNSGATRSVHHKRGSDTFQPIATYEFESRRSVLAEVAVEGGVRDIEKYLVRVEDWEMAGERTVVWSQD